MTLNSVYAGVIEHSVYITAAARAPGNGNEHIARRRPAGPLSVRIK
jgi:L-amino acid N-acyltransferase YncA